MFPCGGTIQNGKAYKLLLRCKECLREKETEL